MFTVKQLSKLAGVTPRTLRHYDSIGLLKPAHVGQNGYRYYAEESLLRLQQILFYREIDMPFENIKKIMGRRDFDVLGALQSHKAALKNQIKRLNQLIKTVDNTIEHLEGHAPMKEKGFFEGFTKEEEQKYTVEAAQMYDLQTVKASVKKWKAYTPTEKQKIGAEAKAIYNDLVSAISKDASSTEAQAVVGRWHRHIEYFWNPDDSQLLGLVDLYNNDTRFRENFEKLNPNFAEFIREAVRVYVQNRRKQK